MSHLFPATTEDERDPREDQNEENRREAEIKGDKPPPITARMHLWSRHLVDFFHRFANWR